MLSENDKAALDLLRRYRKAGTEMQQFPAFPNWTPDASRDEETAMVDKYIESLDLATPDRNFNECLYFVVFAYFDEYRKALKQKENAPAATEAQEKPKPSNLHNNLNILGAALSNESEASL